MEQFHGVGFGFPALPGFHGNHKPKFQGLGLSPWVEEFRLLASSVKRLFGNPRPACKVWTLLVTRFSYRVLIGGFLVTKP